MDNRTPPSSADQEAINRLLTAQHQADVALAACRDQAEAVLASARLQARDMAQKADERISAIHKERGRKIKKRVQLLLRESANNTNHADTDHQRLQQAVIRLADQLIGLPPADAP